MQFKVVLQTIRPSFLILTPVCVFLGLSTSLAAQSPLSIFTVLLVFVGALSAHISVNTLNEYDDFKSGLDHKTDKTRFSGGSGALPGHPELAGTVRNIGLVSLLLSVVIGIYFIFEHATQVIPFGVVGVVLITTYTQWINRSPLLCLVAPGLGFGILMVVGTHLVISGKNSPLAWQVSLVPFFLVNNLLLLNQYPDITADSGVGRNTFPIAFGIATSNLVYAFFMLSAYLVVLFLVVKGYIPGSGIIAVLPVAFSVYALVGAVKYTSGIGAYPRYMGANVVATILTPLLLGISIVSG